MQIDSHDLALCSWSLPSAGAEDLVSGLRELGLSHLQLALAPLLAMDEQQRNAEMRILQSSGITLTAGMISFPGEDYSTIPRIRETGGFVPDQTWPLRRRITADAARLAGSLDLKILSTHVGFIPPADHERYRSTINRIAEIARILQEFDLTLAMETGQESAAHLLRFLRDLRAKNVAVNFDPANMILYGTGDPISAILSLGSHIAHVHLKDAVGSEKPGETWGRQKPIGQGDVDFRRLLSALKSVAYRGPLAIEQESGENLEQMKQAVIFLKSLGS